MIERKLRERGANVGVAQDHGKLSGVERGTDRRASNAEVAGVTSEGFSITRLPAASAPTTGAKASCTG